MIDQHYISLTFNNLKTIYNRTCKEYYRIEDSLEEGFEEDLKQLETIKNSVMTLMEWCSMNTTKLK